MVRTDEQAAKAALDNRVVVATQLFDLVSSNALLDHPLCGNVRRFPSLSAAT